jgi:membrane-bound metal-dependent hydrolase YbcI (DUF457 family)
MKKSKMATPYGHTLVGLSLLNLWFPKSFSQKRNGALFGWTVIGASLQDLDFIPGLLLGQGGRFHHGIFHSVGMGLAASLLLWILVGRNQGIHSLLKAGGLVLGLTFSHLLLDFFTEAPKGFPLFWPFTEASFLSPLSIFPRVERDWGHPHLWNQAWLCFWVETFLLVPLWIASWRYSSNKT